jgi:hypothetical protein
VGVDAFFFIRRIGPEVLISGSKFCCGLFQTNATHSQTQAR